jgi:SPRY domain-containing SOCS box protein 1/4
LTSSKLQLSSKLAELLQKSKALFFNFYSTTSTNFKQQKMDFLLDRLPSVSCEEQRAFGWNLGDRSPHMRVPVDNPLRVQRLPAPNSTDGIRARQSLAHGLHIWEIRWARQQRGTYASIGVGTAKAELHSDSYSPLMGADEHSWGWDIGERGLRIKNVINVFMNLESNEPVNPSCNLCLFSVARKCRHNGQEWDFPKGKAKRSRSVPDRLFCILDMHKGTLAFATQNEHLGIAFRGLDGLQLFPMVSAVWGHAQIGIHYLGSAERVNCEELADDFDLDEY